MRKLLVMLAALFFAVQVLIGCGQNQQGDSAKKPDVVKSEEPVAANTDEDVVEEVTEIEEVVSEEAIKPVADADKAAASAAVVQTAAGPAQVVEAPKAEAPKSVEILVMADFNSGEKPSNIGGNFGGWNKDPSDPAQWCKETFDNVTRHGDAGFSMKLDYSVDSPLPAANGYWTQLKKLDMSKFDHLMFWVRGDKKAGWTTRFRIEFKRGAPPREGEIKDAAPEWIKGSYIVTGVTDKISIPGASRRSSRAREMFANSWGSWEEFSFLLALPINSSFTA